MVTVSLGGTIPDPAITCRGTMEKSAAPPAVLRKQRLEIFMT
jgi:hypothetical protein